jgi:hypothetical protein
LFERLAHFFFNHQPVIVKKLLATNEVTQCVNVDAPLFLLRFAIWLACVVDPARIIALIAAINQLSAFQAEEKRVVGTLRIQPKTFFSLRFSNAFASIFNDPSASRNFASGEHAIAMNGRVAHPNVRIRKQGLRC